MKFLIYFKSKESKKEDLQEKTFSDNDIQNKYCEYLFKQIIKNKKRKKIDKVNNGYLCIIVVATVLYYLLFTYCFDKTLTEIISLFMFPLVVGMTIDFVSKSRSDRNENRNLILKFIEVATPLYEKDCLNLDMKIFYEKLLGIRKFDKDDKDEPF